MKGEYTCILCPTSCVVVAEWDDSELLSIDHSQCKLARDYVHGEIFDPRRTLTSTVQVEGGDLPLVSIKTDSPIPKGLLMEVMEYLASVVVKAPVNVGDVIAHDVLGTGSNIVATKKIVPTG